MSAGFTKLGAGTEAVELWHHDVEQEEIGFSAEALLEDFGESFNDLRLWVDADWLCSDESGSFVAEAVFGNFGDGFLIGQF